MTADAPVMLGEQLARLRALRGLTQEQLAEKSGVSVDVIRKLEQGIRETARLATINKLAKALDATMSLMLHSRGVLSKPEPLGGLLAIRQAVTSPTLARLGALADPDPVPNLPELTESVNEAWRIWQRGDYSLLGALLPDLLTEARFAAQTLTGDDQVQAWGVLATTYEIAAGVAVMLGFEDLAWLAAERALETADRSGDRVAAASARYWTSWILRRQGRFVEAEAVATRAAEQHEPSMMRAEPVELAVWGGLLVNAAGAAARDERPADATHLLSVARSAASRLGTDRADRWSVFGPRIIAQSAVVNATESGDMDEAMRLAPEVDRVGGTVPATWEARYLLALAFAQVETHADDDAVRTLTRAREVTPEWVRYHRLARDLVAQLAQRAGSRRGIGIEALIHHLQVAV